jgi:hypothetical protein
VEVATDQKVLLTSFVLYWIEPILISVGVVAGPRDGLTCGIQQIAMIPHSSISAARVRSACGEALKVRPTTSPARLLGHMLIEEVADLGECLFRFRSAVVE